MAETKATRKELFELAKTAVEGGITLTDEQVEALVEMFDKYIAQLTKPRKKTTNPETEAFRASVATWLSEHEGAYTNAELTEAMGVSAQKMSAALRYLVAQDAVIRIEGEGKNAKATFTIA